MHIPSLLSFALGASMATVVKGYPQPNHPHHPNHRQPHYPHHYPHHNGTAPNGTIYDCTYSIQAHAGDTCTSIASEWGITKDQFIAYNPSVGTDCSKLIVGKTYCVEENHGKPPPTTTSVAVTGTSPTATAGPSPTQSGIIKTCSKYYMTVKGDTCQGIADKFGTFSVEQFETWNPAVKSDCSQLFLDFYYCVGVPGTPTVRPSTTASPTATAVPTQSGIVSNCNKWYEAAKGDTCEKVAANYGITVDSFESWNPAVGSDCSKLFIGFNYCVGTGDARRASEVSARADNPQPLQPGIVGNCNQFYLVKAGDTCDLIARDSGITEATFAGWNKGINAQCSNLFVGYYVCVGAA